MLISVIALEANHDKSLSALNQAKKKEQAVATLHATASAKFLGNPADSAATNGLLSVLDQWQAAAGAVKKAEQANADSQNTLAFAQQKLNEEKQKIMGPLKAVVEKVEQRQKDAQLQLLRSGDPSLIVSILKNKQKIMPFTLAPNAGSGIMEAESNQSAVGNAAGDTGNPGGITSGQGHNPYSQLGIADADYQAFYGKFTESDLLGMGSIVSRGK